MHGNKIKKEQQVLMKQRLVCHETDWLVAPSKPKKITGYGRTDGRTDGPTDRRTDGQTDGRKDGQALDNEQIGTNSWVSQRVNGWMDAWELPPCFLIFTCKRLFLSRLDICWRWIDLTAIDSGLIKHKLLIRTILQFHLELHACGILHECACGHSCSRPLGYASQYCNKVC